LKTLLLNISIDDYKWNNIPGILFGERSEALWWRVVPLIGKMRFGGCAGRLLSLPHHSFFILIFFNIYPVCFSSLQEHIFIYSIHVLYSIPFNLPIQVAVSLYWILFILNIILFIYSIPVLYYILFNLPILVTVSLYWILFILHIILFIYSIPVLYSIPFNLPILVTVSLYWILFILHIILFIYSIPVLYSILFNLPILVTVSLYWILFSLVFLLELL